MTGRRRRRRKLAPDWTAPGRRFEGALMVAVVVVVVFVLAVASSSLVAPTQETSRSAEEKPESRHAATPSRGEPELAGGPLAAQDKPAAGPRRLRLRRSAGGDLTRVVAVGGQWIELQCPLASEMLAIANSGAPKPDHGIVWRKDGTPLSHLEPRQKVSAANGSLVLVNSQPKVDEGSYECALINLAKEAAIKTHRFELRLVLAPRLAPFEFPLDAQVGMKVMLTCSVLEGQQPISFVWLKDGHIISGASESGAGHQHNSLAALHQQQLIDKLALGAQVSLPGQPAAGAKEEPAKQLQPQQQQQQQQQQYVLLGAPQEPARETESLLPLLWDSNMRVRQSDDYSILSIERLELKHAGRYTCSVQNEAARASHSSQLIINAPPTMSVEPKDGDLVSGRSATIDCSASGHPRPTISWLRARETGAKQWDYVPVYDNLRYSILPNGSLSIANATQREQGFYLCSAKNGFGPELTKLIKISVHEPAKFASKYKTVEVRIEERAQITCSASGELPNSIEWFDKDGAQIQRSDKRFIIEDDPQDLKASEQVANATVSRLMIARATRPDSGHYTCQATNKYGTDKMITNLLVQDVPDKVSELKVTNVTASTISIRWQLAFAGNSPVTSYLVQYQSDDPLDDLLVGSAAAPQSRSGAGPSTSLAGADSSLPGAKLGAGADPVQSANERGASGVIQVGASSTSPGAGQSPNSVASSLRAALEALSVSSSAGNAIDRSADELIDRTLVELTVEGRGSTHLVVKDLSPFCVYRLRLAAINKIGLGEFSDWIRAKTEEAPPSGSALRISAAATGPNSIKITWSPPDRRTWNGQLIGFNIAYRPLDSSFEANKTVEWIAPTLQALVFDANSRHQAAGQTHDGGVAAAAAVRKVAQELGKAQQLKASGKSDAGNQTSAADQKSGSYYNLREHLRQLLAVQQQELVAHLTNLQRSTSYLVWIQAINNRGVGPQSHAISVKTLDDVPPSAPAIRIKSASPSSITLAWSMLSNFVSSANHYSLYYRRVPQQSQLIQSGRLASNASLPLNQFLATADPEKAAGQGGGPAMYPAEPGPFIERTITSQQLLMGGNVAFMGLPEHEPALEPAGGAGQSYLHSQSQHYQQFVYTLDQLECGSVYELYMTTRNSVGKSEPSPTITTRTLGEPPLAPANRNSLFARIGISDVALNFGAWLTGGCPLTHVTVRYKQTPAPLASASSSAASQAAGQANVSSGANFAVTWPITTSVPMSILNSINSKDLQHLQHQQQPRNGNYLAPMPKVSIDEAPAPNFSLKNLQPSTSYELEIVAHNSAGHTTAQYEFVTANSNGSRAGYTRREGVYRIDHRGAPMTNQPTDSLGQLQMMDQQQAPFTNQSGVGGQLVPVVLLLLCFVCLLVSSTFCYFRLADSWKRNRRASNDAGAGDDDDLNSKSIRCHLAAANSSPGSYGKSSLGWRPSTGRSTLKLRRAHPDSERDSADQDSPSLLHHCARDPASAQHLLGSRPANNPAPGFSQSVSMRDFNLISPGPAPLVGQQAAATLNFKSARPHMRTQPGLLKAGTLRARLVGDESTPLFGAGPVSCAPSNNSEPNYGQAHRDQQICQSIYTSGTCAMDQHQGKLPLGLYASGANQTMRAIYSNGPQPARVQDYSTGPASIVYASNQCNYQTGEPSIQQETSWTTSCVASQPTHCGLNYAGDGHATNYAIPSSAYPAMNSNGFVEPPHYPEPTGHESDCRQNDASIEACIQHLIDQQQQQQHCDQDHAGSQQQYAIVMGQKGADQTSEGQAADGAKAHMTMATCGQSVIDSSSSSSGIDVGTQLDCGGSTIAATASLAGSQNGYMQTTKPR